MFSKMSLTPRLMHPISINQWLNMKKIISPLILLIWLTGCASTVYRTNLEVYCPPLDTYPEDLTGKLADEIEALKDSSVIPIFIADYSKLRNKIRTCESERAKVDG